MAEPARPILPYSLPPPNALAGSDPHWLGMLSRGCLVTLVAAVASVVIDLRTPLIYFTGAKLPGAPRWVFFAVKVLFAAGALFCNFPRPTSHDDAAAPPDEDPAGGAKRMLAVIGLLIPVATGLLDLMLDARAAIHPSATFLATSRYLAAVAALVGMLAFIRVLRIRARQIGRDRAAGWLGVAFVCYAVSHGVTTALFLGPNLYLNLTGFPLRLPNLGSRVYVPANLTAAAAFALLAAACWSLSTALRRTAAADPV